MRFGGCLPHALLRKHVPSSSNPAKSGWSSFPAVHRICSADCVWGHLRHHEIGDLCPSRQARSLPAILTVKRMRRRSTLALQEANHFAL